MQISGEYGTELLLRYTEERLLRDLERSRVANERRADAARRPGATIRVRIAALLTGDSERMPVASGPRDVGVPAVHAAHR